MGSNPYEFSSLKLHNAPICLRTSSRCQGMPVMWISDTQGRVNVRFDSTYQQVYAAFVDNDIRLQPDSFVPGAVKFVAGGYLTPGCRLSDEEFLRLCENSLDTEEDSVVSFEEEEDTEC